MLSPNPDDPIFLIAEAGVNHNGCPDLARQLIDVAAEAGADAVKFQTWLPGEITGRFTAKVGYLEETTAEDEDRYDVSERLRLPHDAFRDLQDHCKARGILFLSTPDGHRSLDFLVDTLGMSYIKVGSSELNNEPYLRAIGEKQRPVILSTGIGTMAEIDTALTCLDPDGVRDDIFVLQCTSEYPAQPKDMNIRAMVSMGAFGRPVGLSDHSVGTEASVAAVALGARVLEKHFTLDRSMDGPDHLASLDPGGLKDYVASVRRTEAMLGDGRKRPRAVELANRDGIRRSVVAAADLPAGTLLEPKHLTCKRPGTGILPGDIDKIPGFVLRRALREDEPLQWNDLR